MADARRQLVQVYFELKTGIPRCTAWFPCQLSTWLVRLPSMYLPSLTHIGYQHSVRVICLSPKPTYTVCKPIR